MASNVNGNGWDETIDPMATAYRDPMFNRYDDGPGAELDDDLQPGAIASEPTVAKKFDIHIRELSVDFTEQGVRNMCAKYGTILGIKRTENTNWAIVKYDSLSAAENAIEGLRKSFNFVVTFAKPKKDLGNRQEIIFDSAYPEHRPNQKKIDWNRRQILAPFGSPLRLEARQLPPDLNQSDYDQVPNLRRIDPNMDFSHSDSTHLNTRPSVHNGVHVYKESDDVMDDIKRRALRSGGYHGINKYTYPSESSRLNPVLTYQHGTCNKCRLETHLTCARCAEFYCSVSCQRQDWREHRRVCMPMPDLVPSPAHMEVTPQKAPHKSTDHSTKMSMKPAVHVNGSVNGNLSAQAISPKGRADNKTSPLKPTEKPLEVIKPLKPAPTVALSAPPAKNAKVMLTYVHNHFCVFIRSFESTENLNFVKVQNDCASYAKISKPLSVLPAKGDIVLAKFLDIYYRALVIKVNNDGDIKVAFIDFGNKENVKLSELKPLNEDLQLRPRNNFRVILDGVNEKLTNDEVMNYLNGLVDDSKVLKLVYDDTKPLKDAPVRLIDTVTNEIVNECVTALNQVNVVPLTAPPIGMDALEKVDISGDDVELVVLNNSHLCINTLTCVRQTDLEELATNCQRFQQYCQEVNETYTPRLNELCLARTDDNWNRGMCIELAGDGNPCILFIDDGSMLPIPIENIRKMPQQFAYRCVTVDCIIDGLKDTLSAKEIEHLKTLLIVGGTVIARRVTKIVKNSSKDEFKIELPDILNALHNMNI